DSIHPSSIRSLHVSTFSRATWKALLSSAQSTDKLPDSCSDVKALLHHTPSIPRSSDIPDRADGNKLFLEGYSKWSVSPHSTLSSGQRCDLNPTKTSCSRMAYIGFTKPNACDLSDDYNPHWAGFQSSPQSSGNHLCVFVLGWSYVFSARLVELRQMTKEDQVVYKDGMISCIIKEEASSSSFIPLEIKGSDPDEIRWWAAVLAAGNGWQATLTRNGKQYYPPWECHLGNSPFVLQLRDQKLLLALSGSTFKPPSSATALAYLCNFALSHDAFDQLLAAFTAIMTFPPHARFGAPIRLPPPLQGAFSPHRTTETVYADKIPTIAEIPHFMALSCMSDSVTSSLMGCFWEPGIKCNLAGEWLNPPLKEFLPSLAEQKRYNEIVSAMSQRRPRLASLWLGSAITGLLPRVLQVSRTYMPSISLEAAVWTASPQSFMDPKFHRRAELVRHQEHDAIFREDEFRLLYLTDLEAETYRAPPLSPYAPFGRVSLQDASLEVRLHFACGHELHYISWQWKGEHGETMTKASSGVNLSEVATRNTFSWTLFSDGIRQEEKKLWNHEWLSFLV
ncbi:hypothetical protein BO70DRAFT_258581, partial [Aspergillus heteromorphus CBS 117.55]